MADVIRAEVVGSMLRPQQLLDAREQVAAGAITRKEFKRIEDRAVDEAIALQERAGVEIVTDGELRRLSFVGPLTDTVDGVRPIEGAKVAWHDDDGEKPHMQPAIVERLTPRRSLATEEYSYARGRTKLPVKVTLPSPLMLALLWKPGISTEVYDDPFDAFRDAAAIVRSEALALAEMGCPYIQIDAPSLRPSSTRPSATSTRRSASRRSGCWARASSCSTRWCRASTRAWVCTCAAATTRGSG